jgi:electron transfer flavoprotein alpha subunit
VTGDTPTTTAVPTPVLPAALAVIVARRGRLPAGADEAAAEAGGAAVVVGSGTLEAAGAVTGAGRVWWWETDDRFAPAALATRLAPILAGVELVILPASPDGRDLAPRLAAVSGLPLVAGAERVELDADNGGEPLVVAAVARLDDRVLVDVTVRGPAVATLVPHRRERVAAGGGPAVIEPLGAVAVIGASTTTAATAPPTDPEVEAVLEPDLATLDLADARVVVAGGAGLAAGSDDSGARATFALLGRVANSLGGAAGATRVATDAGWTGYERQIGTTGVAIDPDLYVAFGISGAAQHVGGLGSPSHVISVNTDGSCPMTAMADLGLVSDARAVLVELADRLGVERELVPEAAGAGTPPGGRRDGGADDG